MRPPVVRLPQPWLRVGLALVVAGAFGFRVVATPAAWGCMTGNEATGVPGHADHHGHQSSTPDSAPPACVCIAHVSGMGVTADPPRFVSAVPPAQPPRPAIVDDLRPRAADRHLLPFAIGPPTPLA